MNHRKSMLATKPSSFRRAIRLVRRISQVAGAHSLVDDTRVGLARHGVISAIRQHDTPVIFDWLFEMLSYQGVSDSVAYGYMERHGRVRWHDIAKSLGNAPSCPKLAGYWTFENCGYQKGSGLCANPEHQAACPLPYHDLRNGRLNQTAYSLYLFLRDDGGVTIESRAAAGVAPVYPLADMYTTEAVNSADALWAKIEVGTVVLAAQPEIWGPGWWEGIVVGIEGDDLTLRWTEAPAEKPFRASRRDVALRHPGAD